MPRRFSRFRVCPPSSPATGAPSPVRRSALVSRCPGPGAPRSPRSGAGSRRCGLAGVVLMVATGTAKLAWRPPSIHRGDDTRAGFHQTYGEKMAHWSPPVEDRVVSTEYDPVLVPVRVIVSGPEAATPMVSRHAFGVFSRSCRANPALGADFRLSAIDTIGAAGKRECPPVFHLLTSRQDQAAFQDAVMSQLGIDRSAGVVGASSRTGRPAHPTRADRVFRRREGGSAELEGSVCPPRPEFRARPTARRYSTPTPSSPRSTTRSGC